MFDTEEAMVRIDMSEFMKKTWWPGLIGAPPGLCRLRRRRLLDRSSLPQALRFCWMKLSIRTSGHPLQVLMMAD
jgi:hypothetical protein